MSDLISVTTSSDWTQGSTGRASQRRPVEHLYTDCSAVLPAQALSTTHSLLGLDC